MRSQAVREECESACSFWDRDVQMCVCGCAHTEYACRMNNSKTIAPNSGWTRCLHKEVDISKASFHNICVPCLNTLFKATMMFGVTECCESLRVLNELDQKKQQLLNRHGFSPTEQMKYTLGKWLTMHMCVMYCGFLVLSKAERQAVTIKSVLEAFSWEDEPRRSEERIQKIFSKH